MKSENNYGERVLLIIDDIKKCIKELGLKIDQEVQLEGTILISCRLDYDKDHPTFIVASYQPMHDLIDISVFFANVPIENIERFGLFISAINELLVMGHYFVQHNSAALVLRTSFFLTRYSLNKDEFTKVANHCLTTARDQINMIMRLAFGDEEPESIIREYLKERFPDDQNFKAPDGKDEELKTAE